MKRVWIYAVISAILFARCTATKYLPAGEYFYDNTRIIIVNASEIKTEDEKISESLLESIPTTDNRKALGSRPEVWCYFIAGNPGKNAFIKQFVKNTLGTAPVFLSGINAEAVARVLAGKLNNAGYFRSTVTYEIEKNEKKRSSTIIYKALVQRPYYLRNVNYPGEPDTILIPVMTKVARTSPLKAGQQYSLEKLKEELARIEREFKNNGFFFFTSKHLIFEIDSTVADHAVDLELKFEGTLPARVRTRYKLNRATVYCDNPTYNDSLFVHADTLSNHAIDLIYNKWNRKNLVKPVFLTRLIDLEKGTYFSLNKNEVTQSLFMDVDIFRSMKLKYTPTTPDSGRLNPFIFLGLRPKKSLTTDLKLVSKSNGTIGPLASITFTNRNFLKGAEKFDVSLSGAYETQISNQSTGTLNAFELKLESSLVVRKLLLPFKSKPDVKKFLPATTFNAGINFQNRVDYYDISAFNASVAYSWNRTQSTQHEFVPIDISYVNTSNISPDFYDVLSFNPSLAISLQDQFIIATRYTYTIKGLAANTLLNEKESPEEKKHRFFFKGSIEQSGNILGAVMSKVNDSAEKPYEILGSPYAQYLKGDVDVRHYWTIGRHHTLVTNIVAASGYAYGNAVTLPYVKQYSIGGASSIRAFPARTIGPGSYNHHTDQTFSEDSISFTDQYGDIKLQGNIEYRFDIIGFLKGAVFTDAGNIWTFRADSARAGTQFKADEFYKQVAIGTGIGIRLALGVLLLRFDTAIPMRRQDVGWVLNDMDWNSAAWRKENITFNIAIGYPF
jgi:outer membrane protein insertion porin family